MDLDVPLAELLDVLLDVLLELRFALLLATHDDLLESLGVALRLQVVALLLHPSALQQERHPRPHHGRRELCNRNGVLIKDSTDNIIRALFGWLVLPV